MIANIVVVGFGKGERSGVIGGGNMILVNEMPSEYFSPHIWL